MISIFQPGTGLKPRRVCRVFWLAASLATYVGTAHAEIVASLPLQRGFYVAQATACGSASNATLLLVTKDGKSGGPVETKFTRIDKTGTTTYSVTEVHTELRGGRAGPPVTVTYDVPNATTFRLKNEFGTFDYRFCSQTSLPAPWRNNDIRDVTK